MIIQQFSHILNWGVFISASNMSLSLDFIRTIADGDYTQGNSIQSVITLTSTLF